MVKRKTVKGGEPQDDMEFVPTIVRKMVDKVIMADQLEQAYIREVEKNLKNLKDTLQNIVNSDAHELELNKVRIFSKDMSQVKKYNISNEQNSDTNVKATITSEAATKQAASQFAVVTYWWGTGNTNRNFLTSCLEQDPQVNAQNTAYRQYREKYGNKPDGKKYDQMIKDWAKCCAEVGCNFIVEEYPELTIPRGYQVAINAKPLFIKKALITAAEKGLKGVVYIDGDMTVNSYPDIFDMPNIDFMARGWNIDPRSSKAYRTDFTCFDPWIFETSGGIMYFGNTPGAHAILDAWIRATQRPVHAGKADDRIISLIFNFLSMYIPYNVIQLPIEYLWLTDIYGTRKNGSDVRAFFKNSSKGKPLSNDDKNATRVKTGFVLERDAGPVIIEHPACLTSEERAEEQGAAANRSTVLYDEYIEGRIDCEQYKETYDFYEYIFFGKQQEACETYKKYNKYMHSKELYYTIPYHKKYGYFNRIVEENERKVDEELTKSGGTKTLRNVALAKDGEKFFVVFENETDASSNIPKILSKLKSKINVVYIPRSFRLAARLSKLHDNKTRTEQIISYFLKELPATCEFGAYVKNYTRETQYRPQFDFTKPMFFSHNNTVLYQLLSMCIDLRATDKTNLDVQVEDFMKSQSKAQVGQAGQAGGQAGQVGQVRAQVGQVRAQVGQAGQVRAQIGQVGQAGQVTQSKSLKTIEAHFNAIFNSSFIFLTRIRCEFLE